MCASGNLEWQDVEANQRRLADADGSEEPKIEYNVHSSCAQHLDIGLPPGLVAPPPGHPMAWWLPPPRTDTRPPAAGYAKDHTGAPPDVMSQYLRDNRPQNLLRRPDALEQCEGCKAMGERVDALERMSIGKPSVRIRGGEQALSFVALCGRIDALEEENKHLNHQIQETRPFSRKENNDLLSRVAALEVTLNDNNDLLSRASELCVLGSVGFVHSPHVDAVPVGSSLFLQ